MASCVPYPFFPLPCLFFVAFDVTHVNALYTHLEKTHGHLLSLMCWWLLVMRFLQDEKLQGHWLTAHFKHCSLPLPFLSRGTQRMKREREEEEEHIVSHTDTCTHDVGLCGFAENCQDKQALGVFLILVCKNSHWRLDDIKTKCSYRFNWYNNVGVRAHDWMHIYLDI